MMVMTMMSGDLYAHAPEPVAGVDVINVIGLQDHNAAFPITPAHPYR